MDSRSAWTLTNSTARGSRTRAPSTTIRHAAESAGDRGQCRGAGALRRDLPGSRLRSDRDDGTPVAPTAASRKPDHTCRVSSYRAPLGDGIDRSERRRDFAAAALRRQQKPVPAAERIGAQPLARAQQANACTIGVGGPATRDCESQCVLPAAVKQNDQRCFVLLLDPGGAVESITPGVHRPPSPNCQRGQQRRRWRAHRASLPPTARESDPNPKPGAGGAPRSNEPAPHRRKLARDTLRRRTFV